MDIAQQTPSKSKVVNKALNPMNCDSPFRSLPHASTPPSRFMKILNPFEHHLIERLHLPTFSPSVFAQMSTPKTDEKYRWSIDEISSLRPADIDDETLSQHVSEHDPNVESLVQEKIERFFNEKVIAPSPLNEQLKQNALIRSPPERSTMSDVNTQTVLTLPPILPKAIEDVLAPYFNYKEETDTQKSLLYKELFVFEEEENLSNVSSSPAPSTDLSPIEFSPQLLESPKDKQECSCEMSGSQVSDLQECTLSPIGRTRSACRLSFTNHMSVDGSMVVPDVNKSLNHTNLETNSSLIPLDEVQNSQSNNWEMEYKHVSILSKSVDSYDRDYDSSNSNTPHSKLFTSQRKRLSDSFIDEDRDIDMEEDVVVKKIKNDNAESGYHTSGATICESSLHTMFASTPTKYK